MSGNGKPPSRTARARELAAYIEDQPDEITARTEVHIHQPDRFQDYEITRPDMPRPKQESLAEQVLDTVPEVIERADTGPKAAVAIAIVVCLTVLAVVWLVWG